jgi:hypothetical protein
VPELASRRLTLPQRQAENNPLLLHRKFLVGVGAVEFRTRGMSGRARQGHRDVVAAIARELNSLHGAVEDSARPALGRLHFEIRMAEEV